MQGDLIKITEDGKAVFDDLVYTRGRRGNDALRLEITCGEDFLTPPIKCPATDAGGLLQRWEIAGYV